MPLPSLLSVFVIVKGISTADQSVETKSIGNLPREHFLKFN